MTKRIVSLILLVCMLVNILPLDLIAEAQSASSNMKDINLLSKDTNPFKDVNEKDWFYDSVVYVLEQGIFKGTGDDTFSPYGTMTRGMYLTLIGRIAGVDSSQYKDSSFTDVDKDAYYAPYVAWAVQNGITQGVGNNRFNPNGIVSREQMATLTVRFFEVSNILLPDDSDVTEDPKDLGDVAAWAQESVLKLWKAGLFKGSNGRFAPKSNAIRAEAAALSTRISKTVVEWQETKNEPTPTPDPKPEPKPTTPPTPSGPSGSSGSSGSPGPSGPTTPPVAKKYTIKFDSQGGSLVNSIVLEAGKTIDELPIAEKEGAVFLGWYRDLSLDGDIFSESSSISEDTTLYAKYLGIQEIEEEIIEDSFSLVEQEPNLAFNLSSGDLSAYEIKSALSLEIADGSKEVELQVSGSNGNFVLKAVDGFTEGASYKLSLIDEDLSFSDKDGQVRTCSFTIKKGEVYNLELNDGIIYIPSEHISKITKDNVYVSSLSIPLVAFNEEDEGDDSSNTGDFNYMGFETIEVGDVLCIYSGDKPESGDDADYVDDDIAYVTVIGVDGKKISYTGAEPDEVLFIPDMLPIFVGDGHSLINYINNGGTGSFTSSLEYLNFEKFSDLGLNAETSIDVGDFLILSKVDLLSEADEGAEEVDQEEVISYAKVVDIETEGTSVKVYFEPTNLEDIENSVNYHSKNDIDGDQMLQNIDVDELEKTITEQIENSEFADKAASYLTKFAMSTDGFIQVADAHGGLESLRINLADGSRISTDEFQLMAANAKVKLKEKKIKASINKSPKNFNGGIHCTIQVNLTIHVQAGDGNVIEIKLTANFVEKIKLSVVASASSIWDYYTKKVWRVKIKIPYIADYSVSASMDLYNYTSVNFKAVVSTVGGVDTVDVSAQIEKILGSKDKKEITEDVTELYDLYSEMMENGTDWIEIFDQEILSVPVSLLWGAVQMRVTANFVASANINVAIGCNFEYKTGTRYNFWARVEGKTAGTSTVDLMDETYNFQFYVMGILGLRAGIKLEVAVGIISLDLGSVGIIAESGIFTKLYGFFFYEKKSVNNKTTSSKSGALYFELGVYFETSFKAQAMKGKYEYNPTLYENEWTLLNAGQRYNVFDFAYDKPASITFNNSTKTYSLPNDTFKMTYLDLREGEQSEKIYPIGDYTVAFSDKRFSLKDNNIVANIPSNINYLEADMTVTWKKAPLAFSSIPISRSYRLVWDTLNKNGYTITFDTKGGSAVKAITKKYGEAISAPKAPTRAGYTFGGWYSDAALKNQYVFKTMGWENIKVYAKWTANTNTKYKVEHYQEDISNSNKYTLVETQTLTGTTDTDVKPAVRNYGGFTSPAVKTVKIAADGSTKVEYRYTRNIYQLSFVTNNGESNIVKDMKYGASITAPVLKKTGHEFKGWDKAVVDKMPASNLTYNASWTPSSYIISFDSNGGSSIQNKTISYGAKYGSLPIPTRQGYAFSGWYTNESNDIAFGSLISLGDIFKNTSAQTLYAKWTEAETSYKVEHYKENLDGKDYSLVDTESLTGKTGESVTPGVKTYEGFTKPSAEAVTIKADGTTLVKYEYTRNSYTLRFKLENGEEDIVTQVKYEDTIVIPEEPIKTGFTFAGWEPTTATNMPAADVTYTAVWDANEVSYKVEHFKENLDGEYDLLPSETENLTATVGASVTPGLKSYTGFTAPSTQTVTIEADGTTLVKYEYKRNSYNLIFLDSDDLEIARTQVKYEGTITPPVDPTKVGYTFTGWNSELAVTMPAEGVTYTAQWAANELANYTVEYYTQDLDGINYTLEETVPSTGIAGTRITPLVKEYSGFTSPASQTVTIAADGSTVVRYEYTRNSYTLTFEPGNGDADAVITAKYEAEITIPADPERTGYTFGGWYPLPQATMPAGNITFTAQWTANNYTVTFDSNDGEYCSDIVVTYGSTYGTLPIPNREDYTFEGWYDGETEDNGSGNRIESFTTVSIVGDHTLYAKWELDNSVGEAENAVAIAELSQSHEDFKIAQDLVTALLNEVEKDRLQEILDNIIVIYNLALANSKQIEIHPTYCVHNGTRIDYVSKKFAFVITGSSTGSTPLQIHDELGIPVVYDITLRDANIIASSWATAVRFDSNNSDNSLVINLRIEGNVKIEADNHSGIQGNGYSTINLSGTANSTLNCGARQSSAGRAIGERFTINIDEYNIREMKAGNVVTQNITDAQVVGNIKLDIVFQ